MITMMLLAMSMSNVTIITMIEMMAMKMGSASLRKHESV